ncbi:hypothetical protein MRX96_019905 [Rhipicephalus microplus]
MTTTDDTQIERPHEAPQYPAVSAAALNLPCETKFHHVILALTLTETAEVFNIILDPPAEQPHDALKRELIRRTTLSEQKRLQQL